MKKSRLFLLMLRRIADGLSRHANNAAVLLLAILLVGAVFCSAAAQSTGPKLTAAEWQADLSFLAERMQALHPNLFRRIKKEDFDTAVKQFHDQIPAMTEGEIVTGIMKIVAMVHDGHTYMFQDAYFRSGIFPVRLYVYSDGIFIRKAAPEYAGLVGAKVLRIGNLKAEDALTLTGPLAFADNEQGVKSLAPVFLSVPEILAALKINENKQDLPLVLERDGREETVHVKPAFGYFQLLQPPADWVDAVRAPERPLYLKHPDDLYWFEYLKDQKLLYVQQNAVQNKPDESLAAFYRRVMEFVAANPVDKFVLDLRFNGGGNNQLNRATVIGLIQSKVDVRGHLFVIIGRQTFSAAQNFVNELEKYTNAVFVGEPTSEHPNLYGDNRPVILPNSKLEVRVSSLYWQDMDPRDDRRWTPPELAAEVSSADFREGRDPALQAVLDYQPGSSFSDLLDAMLAGTGVNGFEARYRAFKNDPKHRFVDTEGLVNRGGYELMAQKRLTDALLLFKLNAESYPNSANVFDSLGDGYQAAGNPDDALKSYQKALTIDPNLASSLAQVKRLAHTP